MSPGEVRDGVVPSSGPPWRAMILREAILSSSLGREHMSSRRTSRRTLAAVISRSYRMLMLARLDMMDWRERVARGA